MITLSTINPYLICETRYLVGSVPSSCTTSYLVAIDKIASGAGAPDSACLRANATCSAEHLLFSIILPSRNIHTMDGPVFGEQITGQKLQSK